MVCVVVMILVGAFFGSKAILNKKAPDPIYEGKTLSAWAEDLCFPEPGLSRTPAECKKHDQAVSAILHIGTNALPLALQYIQTPSPKNVLEIYIGSNTYELTKTWDKGEGIIRVLGTNAASLIPDLMNDLQRTANYQVTENAAGALYSIGPQTIPLLMAVATNGVEHAEECAVWELGEFGARAKGAVPILLRYLKAKDSSLRQNAYVALAKISDDPNIVVPALIKYFRDEKQPLFAIQLYYALGEFGSNALQAVPILTQKSESGPCQLGAMAALYRIDSEAGRAQMNKWAETHTNFNVMAFIRDIAFRQAEAPRQQ